MISEGETISFDTSASYRLVQHTDRIYQAYELECTNEKDGTKIYAGQANKVRCFAGTHESVVMSVKAVPISLIWVRMRTAMQSSRAFTR